MDKIVFDIETKNSFADVGGKKNLRDLEVSVVGVYSYKKDEYMCFDENELDELGDFLKKAQPLIGFSSKTFDVPILDKYFNYNLAAVPHFDILEKVEAGFGRKVGLSDLGKANLGIEKTASSGLKAIEMYKNGEMDDLKKYCVQDVRITKRLFDYIDEKGHLWIPQKNLPQMKKVKIDYTEEKSSQKQLI